MDTQLKLLRIKPEPSADRGVIELERSRLVSLKHLKSSTSLAVSPFIDVREGTGEFAGHGFYLDSMLDWVLGRDAVGAIVLVPLKK